LRGLAAALEVTVSGTGLRIIGRATGCKIHRKQAVTNFLALEAYRRAERYIVITGDVLPGSPAVLADLDEIMDAVVAELDAGVKHEDPAHHESPVRRLSTRRHIPRHARRSDAHRIKINKNAIWRISRFANKEKSATPRVEEHNFCWSRVRDVAK
jgi:hypothetical protein